MVNNPRRQQMKIRSIILTMLMLCSLAMAAFNLQVKVEKPAGTPQGQAWVTVERDGYETLSGYTNNNGIITFNNVAAGTWWVNASKYIDGMMWYDDDYVSGTSGWKYLTLVLHEPSK
jgi:hypothetical protein